MRKLVIRVFVDGKVKKFTAPRFVSWDTFNKVMEVRKELNSDMPNEVLIPKSFPLLCSIFGHQFTVEQLERGYKMEELLLKTDEAIDYVIAVANISTRGEVVPFAARSRKARTR